VMGTGGNHCYSDCVFQGNNANNGGAISIEGKLKSLQIDNCEFNNNHATEFGGSLYFANESSYLILHCYLSQY